MGIPFSTEGIDRILSAESVTAQQFIDKTSECIVIHSVGIDISLYARNIKKVIGVSSRNEDGRNGIDVDWNIDTHRIGPFNTDSRLIGFCFKVSKIDDCIILLFNAFKGFLKSFVSAV